MHCHLITELILINIHISPYSRCDICNIWLSNANKFYRHNKANHLVLTFKCNLGRCVESYATQEELDEHVVDHQKQKCPTCKKAVTRDDHTCEVNTFVCEICGFTTQKKTIFKRHVDAKHSTKIFECDICGYR